MGKRAEGMGGDAIAVRRGVLVTGANGYIGGAVARVLAAAGLPVLAGTRGPVDLPPGLAPVVTGDLAIPAPALGEALGRVDAVVHAAGLGHRRGVAEAVWRAANVDAAIHLATLSRAAGITRFVLVSSAHVHGRVHDGVVSDATPTRPMDRYAASKLVAERAVAEIIGSGLTIIRPVAVIGPHCPGNMQLLLRLLRLGVPLPFGRVSNRRSFIEVHDLARLVLAALRAPTPPPVVLAAHPQSMSTPAVIRALGAGLGRTPWLPPCPPALLAAAAALTGRAAMWQSLAGDFIAGPDAALALGWAPARSLEDSLAETGRAARGGIVVS